jgi:hypothetical protein
VLGGRTTPALAVLANGTMAHAMDYDDTHPGGAGHPSAPCWSTALALTEHEGYPGKSNRRVHHWLRGDGQARRRICAGRKGGACSGAAYIPRPYSDARALRRLRAR